MMMVKYAPIKVGYYFATHVFPWFVVAALLTGWIGIEFTDPIDWGDHPDSNGHWSALSIVLLFWWIANGFALFISAIVDSDNRHSWDYKMKIRDSKFNNRHEKIVAKPQGDEVNIYHVTSGLNGKHERLLDSFNLVDDLEATDKAIEAAARFRSNIKERKQLEKKKNKPNSEAARLARTINRG